MFARAGKILTSWSFLLNIPLRKISFQVLKQGRKLLHSPCHFVPFATDLMSFVSFPCKAFAFHKVLQQDHGNASFLKHGFTLLHLLNLQHACWEGGLEKRLLVCFLQRQVWRKMLSKEWLPYCPAPCSECVQQCSSDRVAFHLRRYETAQGKVGMTVAFTWALL